MIVRLKVFEYALFRALKESFNSMIVRLKVRPGKIHAMVFQKFQFYDSPIKSVLPL